MGRTLVFLARILQDFPVAEARAIAIDERTAALMEPDGTLRVAGLGAIYFLRARQRATTCRPGVPLTMSGIEVYRARTGSHFDTASWHGSGGQAYTLAVLKGVVASNQADHSSY
jgi:cyanophycinase